MKLEFEVISLENQEILEIKEAYLELNPDHLIWFVHFIAKQPKNDEDKMLGSHEVLNYYKAMALRPHVAGVDKILTTRDDPDNPDELIYTWKVLISVTGMSDDLRIYFKKEKDVERFYQEITKWLLNK